MKRSFKSQITLTSSWINKLKRDIKSPLIQECTTSKYCNIFGIIKEGIRQHLLNSVEIFPQSIDWKENLRNIVR